MLLKTFRVLPGNATSYTNMYVVADEETKEGILIDVAGGIDKVYNYVENMNIKLK
jgi:rRNA processing protein Gar1